MTRSPLAAGRATPRSGSAPQSVLLVEDMASLRLVYSTILTAAGFAVQSTDTAAAGLSAFRGGTMRVVLLDMGLPDRDGLDLMREMLALRPETRVVVITANGSISKAVEAMRAGAHEFIVKPFDHSRLTTAVQNALERVPQPSSRGRIPNLPEDSAGPVMSFIGTSEAMQRVHAKIRSVANSMATVFVTGESGTGKELCALAVHHSSDRAKGPFIALNCGAIPQDLLESEVFGHIKGSFTGAISDKPGAAAAADGGTLFLDEICEMAPALQTKLLRFLQTSTVLPVGATRPRKVNVRIICATNRDPMDAVRRGQFREDLYYRLFVVPLHMPPLRDRGQDVIEIAEAALARFATEEGREFDGLTAEVRDLFLHLPWPGNVRQVLNVIRNVVVLNEGGSVTLSMLPDGLGLLTHQVLPAQGGLTELRPDLAVAALLDRPLAEVERMIIEATIARHGGSVPKAARVLDLSPSTLYRKIESWEKTG